MDRVVWRNRLLFQLRNFTTTGSLEQVVEAIARGQEPEASRFLTLPVRWKIARGRLWNHVAPLPDEEVFARWNHSFRAS